MSATNPATTIEILNYYANLLIRQYQGQRNAYAHIQTLISQLLLPQVTTQTIAFPFVPSSGSFVLSLNGVNITINWNESTSAIQTAINQTYDILNGGAADTTFANIFTGGNANTASFEQFFSGGNANGYSSGTSFTVTGSISGGLLTVTFIGVTPPAPILMLVSTALYTSGGALITPILTETDETLPFAVQNAFNPATAIGVQLDVIGQYVGASRSGQGFTAPITLSDSDFRTLINFAIIYNMSGSSLSIIQALINQFFAGDILVFDYQNMRMSFLISSTLGSVNLIQLLVTEGFLPVPMGVQYAVSYAPVITKFFGFRTYLAAGYNNEPFNSYSSYNQTWPWLSYATAVQP